VKCEHTFFPVTFTAHNMTSNWLIAFSAVNISSRDTAHLKCFKHVQCRM